jgi:hypothetical protein
MDPALQGTEPDIERRVPGNALYVDNDRSFPLPVKIDRFDEAFVTAVREACEIARNESFAPAERYYRKSSSPHARHR